MKFFRRYIRYFIIGFILAALVFGSLSLRATQTEPSHCQPDRISHCEQTPKKQPIPMPDCSKRTSCPLDAAQ